MHVHINRMADFWLVLVLSTLVAVHNQIGTADAAGGIGINYGLLGDNLPSPAQVVNLVKKYNITKLRLFDPNPDALNALRGSQIQVILGTLNNDIPMLAASQEAANQWFQTNVKPFVNDITFLYISVGNEVIPGEFAPNVLRAIQNLQNVLISNNLSQIKVTTVLSAASLGVSYPPSAGAFTPEAAQVLGPILEFLRSQKSALLVNVYPYFAHVGDPANVPLDYATFTASGPVVKDGNLTYWNLFDAMLDVFISAMEKLGINDVLAIVTETGWPSAGNGQYTTPQLASTYNKNLIYHVLNNGTPKRPGALIEAYIFALFNENKKPAGVEQNFGLFYPNMSPVYPVFDS